MSIAGSSRVESDYAGDDRYCDLIIPGIDPVVRVAETEAVLAFHHTRPSYPVHIVVVPKQHVASLAALEDERLVADLFRVIREVAGSVERETGACRVITNLGHTRIRNTCISTW